MSQSWKTAPANNGFAKHWPDGAKYHDTLYINLSDRAEWVPNCLVEDAQDCDGAAPPVLRALLRGDWQRSHKDKRDYTIPISRKYSPVLNATKLGQSKSSCEFNQAFVDVIATMGNFRTKLHPRNPQTLYPSTPDLLRAEPLSMFKVKNVINQTPKHNDSFESIESWGTND